MPSWLLSILPVVLNLLPQITSLWNSSTGNTLQKLASLLTSTLGSGSSLLTEIEKEAATLFPKVAPELQAAAAIMTMAFQHIGVIAWLQAGLNLAQSFGVVQFNGSGAVGATNTPLVGDGTWGPLTMGALEAFQAKFGLPVTGVLTDVENNILTAIASGGLGGEIGALIDTLIADIKKL
jgi:hypothetical protein